MKRDFISEDDLDTFEGYLRYQGVDLTTAKPEELAAFREIFEEAQASRAGSAKIGSIKFDPLRPGENRYAVAVRVGSGLVLTLWIRRDPAGDIYVMIPRGRGAFNPHASYHRNGTFHHKSHDHKMMPSKRQPLTGGFTGCEHLGMFGGHFPKGVGAVCDPAMFSGVVEVAPGLLGPKHGFVAVDLIEPRCDPLELYNPVLLTQIFKETEPWLVVRVGRQRDV